MVSLIPTLLCIWSWTLSTLLVRSTRMSHSRNIWPLNQLFLCSINEWTINSRFYLWGCYTDRILGWTDSQFVPAVQCLVRSMCWATNNRVQLLPHSIISSENRLHWNILCISLAHYSSHCYFSHILRTVSPWWLHSCFPSLVISRLVANDRLHLPSLRC